MNSPSSFEIGRATGNAFAKGYQGYKDRSAIDEILEKANASGNEGDVDNAMAQILSRVSQEKQAVALGLLQKKKAEIKAKNEKDSQKAAFKNMGIPEHVADLPEEVQKDYFKQRAEQEKRGKLQQSFASQKLPEGFEYWDPGLQKSYYDNTNKKEGGGEFGKLREKQVAEDYQSVANDAKQAASDVYAIQTAKRAISSGEITGPGLMAIAKKNPFLAPFVGLTPSESELQAATKSLLGSSAKGTFGAKPTEREIFILLDQMLPAIGKTQEANLAGLNYIEEVTNLKALAGEYADLITNGGQVYVPDFERRLSAAMAPHAEALKTQLEADIKKYQGASEKKSNNQKALSPSQQLIEQARKSRGSK